jgi:hypothetical protein
LRGQEKQKQSEQISCDGTEDFCNGNFYVNSLDMRFELMKHQQIKISWIKLNMLHNLYFSLVNVRVEVSVVENCSSDAEKNEYTQDLGWNAEWEENILMAETCVAR